MMFVACGDDSSSGPDNSSNGNSSQLPTSSGYKYTTAIKVGDGILVSQTHGCAYHSGNFVWEEYTSDIDTSSFKVEGDSLWIGPKPSDYDPDNSYYRYENLSLSNNHDGIYGTWKRTGCERDIATKEITCGPYINGLSGITVDLIITTDSATSIFKIDTTVLGDKFKSLNFGSFIYKFSFEMGDLTEDSLVAIGAIQADSSTIKINTQTFTLSDESYFDDTGMNFADIVSSNGKSCTSRGSLGFVSKEQCLAGDKELLLSERDHSDERWLYEEGPITGFSTSNTAEFRKCMYSLLTQETIDFLNANAHYEGEVE